MRLHSKITKEGEIALSPIQKNYLSKYAGKDVEIQVDRRANLQLIKFFEGAVVPYFHYQSGLAFKTFADARNALKLEFYPEKVLSIKNEYVITAGSLSTLYEKAQRTKDFLEKIEHYFAENGYEFPDSEDFKKWQNSAPDPNEIYAPLLRLMNKRTELLEANVAPWRRKKQTI